MFEKFRAWLARFMQGRYGFDEYGRFLSTCTIVVFILGIVLGLFTNVLGSWASAVSTVISWIAILAMVYIYIRALSRNIPKRRAENERFFKRKRAFSRMRKRMSQRKDYRYLKCGSCGQKMRVPRGKGKISVKCPECGERTVVKS